MYFMQNYFTISRDCMFLFFSFLFFMQKYTAEILQGTAEMKMWETLLKRSLFIK